MFKKVIERLNTNHIYHKKEQKKVIDNVNAFHKAFTKAEMSCYRGDIVKSWINTQKLLRKMFKYELGKKCKECKNCCCNDCGESGGYFSSFDLFMYKLRKLEYPEFKGFLGERGCTIKPDRRSSTCLFYTCEDFPLVKVLVKLWDRLRTQLNNVVVDKKDDSEDRIWDTHDMINLILQEISEKYNPIFEIDKKFLKKNTKQHLLNFRSIVNSGCFNDRIKDSTKYIIRLVEKSLRKVK